MINDFSISDAELIYMMAQNSSCAWEILLSYYHRLIWKRSHEALSQGDILSTDVEDLFQEGCIGFYQSLYMYRPELGVGLAYYINLCVNSSIKGFIRKHRTLSYRLINSSNSLDLQVSEDWNISVIDTIPNEAFINCPQNMALHAEIVDVRNKYLMTLPQVQQDTFKWYQEGYSYKEIAQMLSITEKDVDNTVQKIRRKMRNLFYINN